MPYTVDLHTHSYYSDGRASPRQLVASAKANNPAISHMALSDHNTFAGCREFCQACRDEGIEGFVCAEVSGSHPDLPHVEFHFLTYFGNAWTAGVARRTEMFTPYFNRLVQLDNQNIFAFLEAAAGLGTNISYRQVVRKAAEPYLSLPEPKNPALLRPANFGDLRKVIRDLGLEAQAAQDDLRFEHRIWREAKAAPAPTPAIAEAYAIYRQARPAVVLAHPMKTPLRPDELKPCIQEWQREIGLVGLEAHYGGVFHPAWKALAEELGLLVSVGSDLHSRYGGARPGSRVPVAADHEADIPALLDALRSAG